MELLLQSTQFFTITLSELHRLLYWTLPLTLDKANKCDIAIVGIPFDSGVTFRPGARLGPESIRSSSRLLRQFSINQMKSPFKNKIVMIVVLNNLFVII